MGENSSFYIFFQAPDGAFEAYPVNEWYNFTPFQRYKPLSAEEAEEKFTKRDQILNYFQVKHMNKQQSNESGVSGSLDEPSKKSGVHAIKKEFKVSDMDDWYNSDDDENDASDGGSNDEGHRPKSRDKKNKKEKKKDKRKKKKNSDGEQDDDEPLEESDEGDFDDREVDYMSDSSSDSSESESEKANIKGVIDESALRDLIVSDDDEEVKDKDPNIQSEESNKFNEVNEKKERKVKVEKNGKEFNFEFFIILFF